MIENLHFFVAGGVVLQPLHRADAAEDVVHRQAPFLRERLLRYRNGQGDLDSDTWIQRLQTGPDILGKGRVWSKIHVDLVLIEVAFIIGEFSGRVSILREGSTGNSKKKNSKKKNSQNCR